MGSRTKFTNDTTTKFLEILLQHKIDGNSKLDWEKFVRNLNAKTGQNFAEKPLQNHFADLKGKYIAWYKLKTWTSIAFDAVTGCPLIKQDDRWAAFVKKHKGRPIQFLKRPLANEDLLHAYFKGTFATNKLAISPSMAKNVSLFSDYEDQEPIGDNDDEQDDHLNLNLTPEDNNINHEKEPSTISPLLGKRKSLGKTNKINKRRINDIDKCIEVVKSTIQAESSKVQSNPVQEKFNLLAATLKEIPQMKDYTDDFYIHVLEYLTQDHNGEFFMALATNHQKLLWLKSRGIIFLGDFNTPQFDDEINDVDLEISSKN